MNNKNIIYIISITALILLGVFIAMQFSDEIVWNLFDFIVAGILLLGAGFTYEFISRRIESNKYKIIVGILVLTVFMLIWGELAVGIFGTPFAGS